MNTLTPPIAVVLIASLIAAVADVWKFKVYNIITIPLLVSGLIYHGFFTGEPDGLQKSLLGAAVGFGLLFPFYLLGGVGAGDVKLLAGIGAWLGAQPTFLIFLAGSLAAGVYAIILLVHSGRARETWIKMQIIWLKMASIGKYLGAEDELERGVSHPDRRAHYIPMAAMIAIGLIVILLWIWWSNLP
jgi:prepilin peptidase CpaA